MCGQGDLEKLNGRAVRWGVVTSFVTCVDWLCAFATASLLRPGMPFTTTQSNSDRDDGWQPGRRHAHVQTSMRTRRSATKRQVDSWNLPTSSGLPRFWTHGSVGVWALARAANDTSGGWG
jgi:hypothetical protein